MSDTYVYLFYFAFHICIIACYILSDCNVLCNEPCSQQTWHPCPPNGPLIWFCFLDKYNYASGLLHSFVKHSPSFQLDNLLIGPANSHPVWGYWEALAMRSVLYAPRGLSNKPALILPIIKLMPLKSDDTACLWYTLPFCFSSSHS